LLSEAKKAHAFKLIFNKAGLVKRDILFAASSERDK